MQKNRQGISKQVSPSAVLLRPMFSGDIGEKGIAEGVFTVVGQAIEPDSDGNDTKKYLIEIKGLAKVDTAKARVW